jgi:peptide/nickel transport system substrate-binding protein
MHRLRESPKIGSTRFDWWDEWVALDKYTVVLKLNKFNGNWGYLVGWGAFIQIVPPELGDKEVIKDWRNACGTGPFILADYVPGSSITYVKNPDYWDTTLIDGKEYEIPFVDRVVVPFFPDASIRYAALRAGKVDIVQAVAWQEWDSLAETNPELKFSRYLASGGYVIPVRHDREPTDDVRVRKALSMALDRQSMIETLFGGNGVILNRPANMFETTVYTPLEELPPDVAEQFEYNPEKARQLLADAGYPNGFKIEVMHYSGLEDLASLVKAQWEEIGVEAVINPVDNAVFYSKFYAKEHENALLQWRGIPSAFVEERTFSTPEQIWNPSMYDNAEYQAKYDQMRFETDDAARDVLIKELAVKLLSDIYMIVLPGSYTQTYWQPWVKNYFGETVVGYQEYGPVLAHVWLDLDLKQQMTGQR